MWTVERGRLIRHSMLVGDQGRVVYLADDATRGEVRGGRIGEPAGCYAELSPSDARAVIHLGPPVGRWVPVALRHGERVTIVFASERGAEAVWDGEAADVRLLPHDATSVVVVAASADRTVVVRVAPLAAATAIAELGFGLYGAQWLDARRTRLVGTRAVEGRPVIARVRLAGGLDDILFAAAPGSSNELQAVDEATSAVIAKVRVGERAGYVHVDGCTGAAGVLPWCDPGARPEVVLWHGARCVVTARPCGFTSVVSAHALSDGRTLAVPTETAQPTTGPLRAGDAIVFGVRDRESLRWRAWTAPQSPAPGSEPTARRAFATMSLAAEHPGLAVVSWNEIDAPLATVVALHGGPFGAWGVGGEPALTRFEGWARVVRVNYTGSTGYGEKYRAALEGRAGEVDVAEILHVLARVSLRWDEPLLLYGESYGGYLALTAGLRSSVKLAGVVALAGFASPARLLAGSTPGQAAMLKALFGGRLTDVDSLDGAPDGLQGVVGLAHGELDTSVPPAESERIHRRLADIGVRSVLRVFPGEGHTLSPAGFEALNLMTRAIATGQVAHGDRELLVTERR